MNPQQDNPRQPSGADLPPIQPVPRAPDQQPAPPNQSTDQLLPQPQANSNWQSQSKVINPYNHVGYSEQPQPSPQPIAVVPDVQPPPQIVQVDAAIQASRHPVAIDIPPAPTNNHKPKKKLIIIASIVGFIVLVSAAATAYVILSQKNTPVTQTEQPTGPFVLEQEPEEIFDQVLANAMDIQGYKETITIKEEVRNLTIVASHNFSDLTSLKSTGNYKVTNSQIPATATINYLTIAEQDYIQKAEGSIIPDSLLVQTTEKAKKRWITLDRSSPDAVNLVVAFLGEETAINPFNALNASHFLIMGNVTDELQPSVLQYARQQSIYKITAAKPIMINNKKSVEFSVTLAVGKLPVYAGTLGEQKTLLDTSTYMAPNFKLLIDLSTKLPISLTYGNNDSNKITFSDFKDEPPVIEMPPSPKPIANVLKGPKE